METVPRSKSRPFNKPADTPRNGHSQQGPSPETLDLTPAMSFGDAGRAVLAFHLKHIDESEGGTVRGDNPEALHDMRVATRRLRASMRDFRSAFGKTTLEPFEEDIGWLDDLLGPTRDLDVFIAWLRNYLGSLPEQERPYIQQILEEREAVQARARAALLAGLRSDRYYEWKCNLQEFLNKQGTDSTPRHAMGLAVFMIDRELDRVHKKGKGVNARRLSRLHRLRIECKRLRYTAEIFSSLFPGHLEPLIERAKDMQDSLGTVHDSHLYAVFLGQMQRMQSTDPGMEEALNGAIRILEQEQKRAYRKFKKTFRKFDARKFRRRMAAQLRKAQKDVRS